MKFFNKSSKITPKEAIKRFGPTIKTNVTAKDLSKGAEIQLKRATDINFRLNEIKQYSDSDVIVVKGEVLSRKSKLKKPKRRIKSI
ncbi:hypothetical protein [Exiguobacterium sp. s194]|uniref:hypothetical protein n=1 Tax=Exiguobacterium sp. s194 TaxID=2751230 RepID=UPI001BE5FE40|nr:hypothetical protein [Exiguobacterium sp. s194]